MDNSDHTHFLPVSWWLSSLLVGALMILILVYSVISISHNLVSGAIGLLGILEILVIMILLLPAGILLLTAPFSTKVIVLKKGLEYHTSTFILQTDWQSLTLNDNPVGQSFRDSLFVIPKEGTFQLRGWARPFRRMLKHEIKDVTIPIGQFGSYHGHSLEMEVREYISNQAGQQ
jgi:hypothetical protein